MSASVFPGFPPGALAFFRGLSKNNDRDWFQERKEIYETQVKAPMIDLVTALNRDLMRLAPDCVTDPQKSIYRIYRDTRFSPDKTPYKTHIAAIFKRRGLDKHAGAGLYFSVSPKEVEVAGGVYMPGPSELLAIRTHLAGHHAEFLKIVRSRTLRSLMGELQGDQLSRVPKGFDRNHPAADLLRRKQWLFYVLLDPKIATQPAIYTEVSKRFRAMIPLIEFLNAPLPPSRREGKFFEVGY